MMLNTLLLKKYTLMLFILGLAALAFGKFILFAQFENKLNEIAFSLFLLVYSFEFYIVFLSFLAKDCTRLNQVEKIFFFLQAWLWSHIFSAIIQMLPIEKIFKVCLRCANLRKTTWNYVKDSC